MSRRRQIRAITPLGPPIKMGGGWRLKGVGRGGSGEGIDDNSCSLGDCRGEPPARPYAQSAIICLTQDYCSPYPHFTTPGRGEAG